MNTDPGTARRARERFDRAVDGLPAATANRLRLARRAALAAPTAERTPAAWALPMGAALAVLLGLAWWRQGPAPTAPAAAQAQVPAMPTPSEPQVEDDVELYAWLADTPVASDAEGGAL
jgi:hypothetical protein